MKRAFITGVTGQDGSYLAEFLLQKGYEVHGAVRRVAIEDPEHRLWRLRHILNKLVLHAASLESFASIFNVVDKVQPDEIYHLAAQSFVSYSFEDEFSTIGTNINGTHYVLAAMKERAPRARFYFAASSEMYGNAKETPQNENTSLHPRSPYGISKVAGFQLTENYRQAYNLYAVSGICFNHESPRRGYEFVSRKVANAVARIKVGLAKELVWVTLHQRGIGVMRLILSKPCGSCCNKMSQMTTSLPPEKVIQSRILCGRRLAISTLTMKSIHTSTTNCTGRRKSMNCEGMRLKHGTN
jgi:GDPmannose 4,6-dehydratase